MASWRSDGLGRLAVRLKGTGRERRMPQTVRPESAYSLGCQLILGDPWPTQVRRLIQAGYGVDRDATRQVHDNIERFINNQLARESNAKDEGRGAA